MTAFKKAAFKTACFYTVASLLYSLLVAVSASGDTTLSDVYTVVLKNFLALFGYSAVFGASSLLLESKKLRKTAARLIHAAVNYAAMLCTFFIMASVTDDLRNKILFSLVATLVFVVVYCAGALISSACKKARRI